MTTTSQPRHDQTASSLLDHACVVAAFAVASAIASLLEDVGLFVWPPATSSDLAGWPKSYLVLLLASLVLWAAVTGYTGIYRPRNGANRARAFPRLWRTVAFWAAATTAAIFFLKLHAVSRQFSLTFFAAAACLITLRELCETILTRRLDGRWANRWALVVGTGSERHTIAAALTESNEFRPDRVREVNPTTAGADAYNPMAVNAPSGSEARNHAFIVAAGLDGHAIQNLVLGLLRHRWCVHVVPILVDTKLFRYSLEELDGTPAIRLEAGHMAPAEAALKRALDVVGAIIGLVALVPFLALIAAATKLTSPGPILFSQLRVGKDGTPFRIHKFRSMRSDAEALLARNPDLYAKYVANNFKVPKEEDFRITCVGRFLRATSLDELPQLWNVLKGEMSLVGPRPVVPDEIARYGEFAHLLLSVKPGITGHWQTSGRSRIAEYSRRVLLDMEYVRDQSLRTDMEILIRTVGKVARREGSY